MTLKLKVGDILYSLNVGNAARHSKQVLTPVVVRKVERLYFICAPEGGSQYQERKYRLDDWGEETGGYSADSCLYASEQEWWDENETNTLRSSIKGVFDSWTGRPVSLPVLRQISALLAESEVTKRA